MVSIFIDISIIINTLIGLVYIQTPRRRATARPKASTMYNILSRQSLIKQLARKSKLTSEFKSTQNIDFQVFL